MSMMNHVRAILTPLRKRATMAVLAHRIRARHPTLEAHPTSIWDYGYHDIDAIEIGRGVVVGACSMNPGVSPVPAQRRSWPAHPWRWIGHQFRVNIRAAGGTIRIGPGSGLSANCVLIAANHTVQPGELTIRVRWDEERCGIDIGSNVWVGANCVILPGSTIGDNSIIAAGSVVRGTVPPGELWGGVPARKIKAIGAAPQGQ